MSRNVAEYDTKILMATMSNYLCLSRRRMLLDGLLLGAVFTIVAVGCLWLDARLWLQDYPPDIQAAAASAGEAPLALRIVAAAVLFGALLSGMVYSNWLMAREHGSRPRPRCEGGGCAWFVFVD